MVYHPYEKCVYYVDTNSNVITQIIPTPKNVLFTNTTGRPVNIAITNGTVTNPTLHSVAGVSDIKTLQTIYSTSYNTSNGLLYGAGYTLV
jgi:hypothetical protein